MNDSDIKQAYRMIVDVHELPVAGGYLQMSAHSAYLWEALQGS